ncbi:3-oxoacyl-ACP synthase [Kitasatospora sp. MMS16-BH015]|uniref:ketoacyl-ACP synthase III family protein n=1 Tax=Kitasatospora sp. MMS16-BH015 TaxID=2018025 RepID=UPI000CA13151|nr:ketoacyl-ACP synthase III family protein [Kitasatospora sp. MMS16-BH015]AUG78803.1 3-oxoacyl-ACP synthase [Kitasatospora sp. MMS16-BH015]
MRWDNLYIAGLGAYLPPTVSAAEAAEAGAYDRKDFESYQIRSVTAAPPGLPAVDMAVAAASRAVRRSGHKTPDFGLVLHASMFHQGQDMWTPAHYVQREVLGGNALALDISPGANGGLAGLELAASHLASHPADRAVLLTCADAFRLPRFDRWRSDDNGVFGDGAAALVLSRYGGPLQLLASASAASPELEPVCRGYDGWTDTPYERPGPVDIRGRKAAWFAKEPNPAAVFGRLAAQMHATVGQALRDAEATLGEVAFLVHANFGTPFAEGQFHKPLGIEAGRTMHDWGLDVGHVGGADQLLGLHQLVESGRARQGDLILLLGASMGFSWTAAVARVTTWAP